MKVSVLLDEQRDADIIRWLESQPNKSGALRKAARVAMEPPLHADIIRRIVHEELQHVRIAAPGDVDQTSDSPEKREAARKLHAMF